MLLRRAGPADRRGGGGGRPSNAALRDRGTAKWSRPTDASRRSAGPNGHCRDRSCTHRLTTVSRTVRLATSRRGRFMQTAC